MNGLRSLALASALFSLTFAGCAQDKTTQCGPWAASGFCTGGYASFMAKNCPTSCCPTPSQEYVEAWKGLCTTAPEAFSKSGTTLEFCTATCEGTAGCTGIAYHEGGHCRVYTTGLTTWTGSNFLEYTCFRHQPIGTAMCLDSANSYRAKHADTGALIYDADLAAKAQSWANALLAEALANGGSYAVVKHDPRNNEYKTGENIFVSSAAVPGAIVDYCGTADTVWYGEEEKYNYQTGPEGGIYAPTVGHFTQMVWSESTKVGYGVAEGVSPRYAKYGRKFVVVVAKYQTPGNYVDDFTTSVKPLLSETTSMSRRLTGASERRRLLSGGLTEAQAWNSGSSMAGALNGAGISTTAEVSGVTRVGNRRRLQGPDDAGSFDITYEVVIPEGSSADAVSAAASSNDFDASFATQLQNDIGVVVTVAEVPEALCEDDNTGLTGLMAEDYTCATAMEDHENACGNDLFTPYCCKTCADQKAALEALEKSGMECGDILDKKQCKKSTTCRFKKGEGCSAIPVPKACSELVGKECKKGKNKRRCRFEKTEAMVDGLKVKTRTCVDKE